MLMDGCTMPLFAVMEFIQGIRNSWLLGEVYLETDLARPEFVAASHPDRECDALHCFVRATPCGGGMRVSPIFEPGRFALEDSAQLASHFLSEYSWSEIETDGPGIAGNSAGTVLQIEFLRFMIRAVGNGSITDQHDGHGENVEKWPRSTVLKNMLAIAS